MAEPISLAASIITIVHVTDAILVSCYRFVGKAKSAAADVDRIIREVGSLKVILLDLYELAEEGGPSLPGLNSLARPDGPLAACSKALAGLEATLAPSTKSMSARQKLLWPFESKKVDEILESIQKQKPSLSLALMSDNTHVTLAVRDEVQSIQKLLESAEQRKKREKILNWLLWNDPKEKHSASRRLHQEGSNQWILDSEAFRRWKMTPGQAFWLHGIPGSGKTIICSSIINHIQEYCNNKSDCRLAYYYFDFNDSRNQKIGALLRSLIVQLSSQVDILPQMLEELFDRCNHGRSSPEDETLASVLFSLLDEPTQTFVVIDGLDEYPLVDNGSERDRLHKLVTKRIGKAPGSYNFLCTSRKERDIEDAMAEVAEQTVFHNIPIKSGDIDADVRLHVQRFIQENKRIKNWSAVIQREIEEAIVNGAQGMFRWAVCQLESIGACALPATARKQLKQLPRTLDETYDRILKSIPEVNESAARAALMFLAKSMRPLTLEELAEAVIINVEDQRFSIEERLGLPLTDILEICSSLVTVSTVSEHDAAWMREKNTIERGCGGREVSIIRFAHFSVKEYLASDRLKETPLSAYYFSESIAHQYIAEASLVYLFGFSNGERVVGADFQEYRFLAYAARFWHEHWRKIPPDEEQNCLTQLLQQMYDPDRPSAYINWLNIFNPDFREYHLTLTRRSGRRVEHFPSPVYFTAYFGHYGMSEWLISSGCDTNSSNGARMLGGPLQVTAYAGHTDIVRLLLNNSATVNTKCGHFGDALQAAAFGGHEEIVKLLFQHGAIANTECGRYGSALIAAAQEGHFKVAKLLIEYGAEPNTLSERHGKALAAAAASGGMEIVKLLLTSGNDINDTNGMKGSALYSASAGRDLNVVRILLKAGADIDLLSGEMNTALQAACSNRHIDVVRFLLAKGADVNIRGGKYGDALQACTHNGDPGIFHLLLKHGANIEHEGGTYYSALWCAVYTCKTIAAEILLDRGATCSDEIFLMAIQYQLPTIVSRLLKRGVDVNAQGKEGSALQLAITHNGLDIASILLQSEDIDVNARDGVNGGSPLHSALVQGNEQIVRNLLERGADVNSVGGDCHKPLTAAVVSGKESLFLLLLDEGADLNGHREGRYRSPLIEAAGRGYEGIVRLLLDRGVDVNEYGYDQSNGRKENALQAAAYSGKMEVVKLLISRGADINAPEGENGSALECSIYYAADFMSAKRCGNTDIMHYLLDNGAALGSSLDRDTLVQGNHGYGGPLNAAIQVRRKDLVSLFLDRGADVDGVHYWWHGSALEQAIDCGDVDTVKLLLERGADVNKNSGNYSPLTTALYHSILGIKSYHTIIQLLLEAGADVNFQSQEKMMWGCPLGYAVYAGNVAYVEQFIELGADVNASAGIWDTILCLAVFEDDIEIVRLLIRHGADVMIKTPPSLK